MDGVALDPEAVVVVAPEADRERADGTTAAQDAGEGVEEPGFVVGVDELAGDPADELARCDAEQPADVVVGELHAAVAVEDQDPLGQVVDHESEALLATGQVVEAAVHRALQDGVVGVGGELVGEDGGADAGDQDAAHPVARRGPVDELEDPDAEGGQRGPVPQEGPRRQLLAGRVGVQAVGAQGGDGDETQPDDPQEVAERARAERRLALVEAVDAVADRQRHCPEGGDLQRPVATVQDGDERHRDDGDVGEGVGDEQRPVGPGDDVVLDHVDERHLPEHERQRRGDDEGLGEPVQPSHSGPEVGAEPEGEEAGEQERQAGQESDVGR